ncbi:hypothetical protein BST65_20350 [Bradyrhizobium canariense]|nr:hypothetical protein BST65_20350 [Bradyrhizobium canariense]OSI31068.1 hypothetical protein BST66_21495 [Bradyrhizobium canariense]OSI39972.1 hypothetical protein BSZ20_29045 [Bradyrhizobium canariense]OSI48263.1 hypothetical protein BST67_19525 [Bradyrhizobium canariense]OSI50148.1 hypothetical protein BSZ15_34380 [Bradyrhizobium canariense]
MQLRRGRGQKPHPLDKQRTLLQHGASGRIGEVEARVRAGQEDADLHIVEYLGQDSSLRPVPVEQPPECERALRDCIIGVLAAAHDAAVRMIDSSIVRVQLGDAGRGACRGGKADVGYIPGRARQRFKRFRIGERATRKRAESEARSVCPIKRATLIGRRMM